MKHNLLIGTLTLGAMAAASLLSATPAQAFSWGPNFVTFNSGDKAGTSFEVLFNGFINEKLTQGLTSKAKFKLVGDYNGGSSATFDVQLDNTSDSSIFNNTRVSGFGFNTNPDLASASVNVVSGDIDNAVLNSNIPGQSIVNGRLDICFTAGNSCAGGGGDGVNLGDTATFRTTLNFLNATNAIKFDLTDFAVRYQSIRFKSVTGNNSGVGVDDEISGTGVGTVPTPALLPGLLSMGFAALRNKKKQEVAASESASASESSLIA